MPEDFNKQLSDAREALKKGRAGQADDSEERAEVARSRFGKVGVRGTSDIRFATQRPKDPMWYWEQNNLPYDITKDDDLVKLRDYCNTPDAPVWMGDYSFKPMGEIVPGDIVIGWEYTTAPGGGLRKKLVRTPVTATNRRWADEVVKVTMESGRVIKCTPDHKWANPHYSPGQKSGNNGWHQPQYRPVKVGRTMIHVVDPTPELTDPKDIKVASWLGGVYDGEGTGQCIAQSAQHNPDVLQRIVDSLHFLGLPAQVGGNGDHVYVRQPRDTYGTHASKQAFVDFLNKTDPTRRITAANDKKLLSGMFGEQDRVASIESMGPGEVISMETGTGNYTAWGFASRNCRAVYMTHPVIGSAIDIYTKYPLVGLELTSKDPAITEFYTDLFFNQLNYHEFLEDVGREYWTVGEAFPLGSFNETLGVWEDDELINPNDVDVIRSPFLKEPRFEIRLPEPLRKILQDREPAWEYEALVRSYPELINFLNDDARMPVSNVLLQQMKFKGHPFHPRGIPLLMRAIRSLVQEEMLNAAQDAIADRLYTPLILAKLGASATELGTQSPWIPTAGDRQDFIDALDAALAGDFRVLVTHFAVDMTPVLGREAMPRFENDFGRLEEKQLQVFGLSKTMLSGSGGGGQTYAADALNRDLVTQILTSYQRKVEQLFRQRALVVAEAQEHYDFEERGGKRYPIMEEVLVFDEETGDPRIEEQPKLLIPDIAFRTMNMRNESEERNFVEALRASGVPISMKTRLMNLPIDLEDELETLEEEQVDQAVRAGTVQKQTFEALSQLGLPVPADLEALFRPKARVVDDTGATAPETEGQMRLPAIGLDDPAPTTALAPTYEDLVEDGTLSGGGRGPGRGEGGTKKLPTNKALERTRPAESDEQRKGMPRSSAVESALGQEGITDEQIGGLQRGPRHIGSRRPLDPNRSLDEQDDSEAS